VKALNAEKIPFVIQGMNTLFDTREANAARALFYFMVDRENVDAAALASSWRNADLGLDDAALDKALALAADRKARLVDAERDVWSVYNLQRLFLDFLETVALREERVPEGRGEVVFYNLGQFSQLISDFETIHFHSKPAEKYENFASFLQYSAEDEYAEGIQSNAYANPDAVRILTVHKAKGLQWPAVFVPAVLRNRFPMAGIGGATAWHLLPGDAVRDAARYKGGPEDERRLFYVALTRAQKYLFVTWAPVAGNQRAQKPSEYVEFLQGSKWVKRFDRGFGDRPQATPAARESTSNVVLSFSELKYFFECPYQFKLRVLYGFNAPLAEALGYGRSLHNALAEIHKRAIEGRATGIGDVPALLDTHLHLPYAYPALVDRLRESGAKVITDYLAKNQALLSNVEFAEKSIEVPLGDGVTVAGRIDLVYQRDTRETAIVDLKSTARAQAEDVTETQLHIYALGYRELTRRDADYVEIWELEEQRKKPRAVDQDFIDDVKTRVRGAADALRRNHLPVAPWAPRCKSCDYCGMCSAGAPIAAASDVSD
jgi:DNA helicase-2/ATP-dependent DNA helicase PcrA